MHTDQYPPSMTADDFRFVPARLREDAIQEAWVAYLERADPWRRIQRFVRHQRRQERRQTPGSQLPQQARLQTGPGARRHGWVSPARGHRGQIDLSALGSDLHRTSDEETAL